MRVLALFAWLMLVLAAPPAAAMGSAIGMPHSGMSVAMRSMMGHDAHHAAAHTDGCCGNPAHSTCHCDAMCGTVLLPVVSALSRSSAPVGSYALLRGIDAPTVDPVPPLRPPAA
jgi:hypothetical protein